MINAMNFADIFNIKIFKENNDKVKLVNEEVEVIIKTDEEGRIPLNKTAKELNIQ